MEITKKELEKLIGRKVREYKVEKVYEGDRVVKLNITAIPVVDASEVKVTIKVR